MDIKQTKNKIVEFTDVLYTSGFYISVAMLALCVSIWLISISAAIEYSKPLGDSIYKIAELTNLFVSLVWICGIYKGWAIITLPLREINDKYTSTFHEIIVLITYLATIRAFVGVM